MAFRKVNFTFDVLTIILSALSAITTMYLAYLHSKNMSFDSPFSYMMFYQITCGVLGFFISNIQSFTQDEHHESDNLGMKQTVVLVCLAVIISKFSWILANSMLGFVLTVIAWRLSYNHMGRYGIIVTTLVPIIAFLIYLYELATYQVALFSSCLTIVLVLLVVNYFWINLSFDLHFRFKLKPIYFKVLIASVVFAMTSAYPYLIYNTDETASLFFIDKIVQTSANIITIPLVMVYFMDLERSIVAVTKITILAIFISSLLVSLIFSGVFDYFFYPIFNTILNLEIFSVYDLLKLYTIFIVMILTYSLNIISSIVFKKFVSLNIKNDQSLMLNCIFIGSGVVILMAGILAQNSLIKAMLILFFWLVFTLVWVATLKKSLTLSYND